MALKSGRSMPSDCNSVLGSEVVSPFWMAATFERLNGCKIVFKSLPLFALQSDKFDSGYRALIPNGQPKSKNRFELAVQLEVGVIGPYA